MAEYYTFDTENKAVQCVAAINASPHFPITGKTRGRSKPNAQKTTAWALLPIELVSGRWAVPRVPAPRMDSLGVSVEDRQSFMAVYGKDILELANDALLREDI